MLKENGLHKAQVATLFFLRHNDQARFSDLLKTTKMTSDNFKFHLAKLQKLGYIKKHSDKTYSLTPRGKEFANRLDIKTGLEIQQSKSSLLLVARSLQNDEWLYLAQYRTREPFYGFWGVNSAPLLRGLPILESANQSFKMQTGLDLEFNVKGNLRIIDKNPQGEILEDKLFTVLLTEIPETLQAKEWIGGSNHWMSRRDLLSKKRLFPTTELTLDMCDNDISFIEKVCLYSDNEY